MSSHLKPCTCAQRGPVTIEQDAPGEYRAVCCFCWRQTDILGNPTFAATAWNAGLTHRDES